MQATELFENAMDWLREHYAGFEFYLERDVVWTVQKHIAQAIKTGGFPYQVVHEYKRADLVILNEGAVEVAIEFKYEPSHSRSTKYGGDILPTKFPVAVWTGEGSVEKDVQRVRGYVEQGKAKAAYSVFIDEGGEFSHRDPHPGSEWRNWGRDRWVLWSQVGPLAP